MYKNKIRHNGDHLLYRRLDYTEAIGMARARDALASSRDASYTEDQSFTGTSSLRAAIELAQYGWVEGVKKIEDKLRDLDQSDMFASMANRPIITHDVVGSEVDVASYLAGIPEHMTRLEFVHKPNRAVKIALALSQHASVSKEEMLKKASGILLAVEILRTAGYNVEVTGIEYTSSSGYGNYQVLYEIPILEAGGYLSSAHLAFMLGHPSFLRRIIFALKETEDEAIRNEMGFYAHGGGYGYPINFDQKLLRKIDSRAGDDATIYIIGKDDGFHNPIKTTTEIINGVKKASDRVLALA